VSCDLQTWWVKVNLWQMNFVSYEESHMGLIFCVLSDFTIGCWCLLLWRSDFAVHVTESIRECFIAVFLQCITAWVADTVTQYWLQQWDTVLRHVCRWHVYRRTDSLPDISGAERYRRVKVNRYIRCFERGWPIAWHLLLQISLIWILPFDTCKAWSESWTVAAVQC